MLFVDARGRRLEVILLDRGRGPKAYIRVSQNGILLGAGYYQKLEDALRWVDVESLVEVIPLR